MLIYDVQPVNATQRPKLCNIVSDFYQAYVNTYSPCVYYMVDTDVTTITRSLTFPSTRAVVSRLHAITLGVLLLLLAALLAVTLLKQPLPNSAALRLYPGTISSYVMAITNDLYSVMTPLSDLGDDQVRARLGHRRFSIDHRGGSH